MARRVLSSDELSELRLHRDNVSGSLESIQNLLGRDEHREAKIRFPRGFIRTATTARTKFEFVRSGILRTNIAYTVMLSDVYYWLLSRTDLVSTVREMIVKSNIALAGSICEALLRDHFEGVMGRRKSYRDRTKRLVQSAIITQADKDDLDWLWDRRCNVHLFEIPFSEIDVYTVADNAKAVKSLRMLMDKLENAKA